MVDRKTYYLADRLINKDKCEYVIGSESGDEKIQYKVYVNNHTEEIKLIYCAGITSTENDNETIINPDIRSTFLPQYGVLHFISKDQGIWLCFSNITYEILVDKPRFDIPEQLLNEERKQISIFNLIPNVEIYAYKKLVIDLEYRNSEFRMIWQGEKGAPISGRVIESDFVGQTASKATNF